MYLKKRETAILYAIACPVQHVNYDNLAKADPQAYEPTEIRSSLSILLATSVNNDRITLMPSLGFDLR